MIMEGLLKELDNAIKKVYHNEPKEIIELVMDKAKERKDQINEEQAPLDDKNLGLNEGNLYPEFLRCGVLKWKDKNSANPIVYPAHWPMTYSFPTPSLYIENESDGQFLREMLMRLLSSMPLIQLEVVLVDALSLGNIFKLARRLLSKENDFIYQQRILTESNEIEEALKHLYEYLKVNLQEKLAGFKDFAEYNKNAKDPLPLKALFLSGVDALNSNAHYYLEKIVRFGSSNGVLSFINLKSEKDNPTEAINNLKKYAQPFKKVCEFNHLSVEVINGASADNENLQAFADKIKKYYEIKREVKRELKDLQRDEEFLTKNSQYKVSVPIGWDINHKEVRFEIGDEQNHTLICGRSGSGKSNFLHVLVQNLAFYYAPSEVQLFLLDYKEGVEFNAYVEPTLEHARLVSVESSVSYGITFLEWLCKEIQNRANQFKQFKVKDLKDYREHGEMPRFIVVIDEFQVLFSDSSNKQKNKLEQCLNTLLKKGRSYGIHLVLSTQTMRGTDIHTSLKAQIANRIALSMDAEDSMNILTDEKACELVRPWGIFNNNGGHRNYHTKMTIPKAPDDFKDFILKIKDMANQKNLPPIEHKIYNGEEPLKLPNTLGASGMCLHLGKKVDYEQDDFLIEFDNNESHLLVVSNDLNARIDLMKLLAQNIKSADKELLFYHAEKRRMGYLDRLKEYGVVPTEHALDRASNPNSVLMIDNLNEAKELHTKEGLEKLKIFLETAIDNECYCIIFVNNLKQIPSNYNASLKDLLKERFKQNLAYKCNAENLNAITSDIQVPLNKLDARLIDVSKDSITDFRPFSL
ncbi:FtsK/SpoIIIE domain-containing protein [Helicobacter cetorum]|uniref:FtsK/SpoIIIE domain-containing protein n=1 Tax=Helicobacter cetorum TaxID=138563 RepID=UPI000CF04F25|nr:FtsK/SpoIIIE domain-containing protein [Helicobacter cetorum]